MTLASFTTPDGTKIAYKVHGNAASTDRVVLVHSLAMDHSYWQPVAEALAAAGVCAVAVDCRGHGASDKPAAQYTIATFADDMVALLDHLGWPKAVFGGSSMGGSVSLGVASYHPARVAGLALIDTTSCYGEGAPKAWAERADAAKDKGLASLTDFQRTRWFSDAFREAHADVVQRCVDVFLKNDIDAYASTCRMLGNFDLRDKLPGFKVPARIVVGDEDYATPPAMAQEMHKLIPGSTYRLIEKARHLMPLERPDVAVEEILAVVQAAR